MKTQAPQRLTEELLSTFYGPNLGYFVDLYEQYLQDPTSVDEATRHVFEQMEATPEQLVDRVGESALTTPQPSAAPSPQDTGDIQKVIASVDLVSSIREYGHLAAHFVPTKASVETHPLIQLESYGLTWQDLERIPANWIWNHAPSGMQTGRDAVDRLLEVYTGEAAFEFGQVNNPSEREWLYKQVESTAYRRPYSVEDKKNLLKRLTEVEMFERFLHRTFAGQKRFSIEGVDTLVPMLDLLVHQSVKNGVKDIMIGMAHRGRLNVLAHVLGKPYAAIFSEFRNSPNKDLVPSEGSTGINFGWTGDVKYHLGAYRTIQNDGGPIHAKITLANNPSHLEFVNPVVEGYTRAAQDDRSRPGTPAFDRDRALAVLIHGDAAFPGEGIVPETLNLSRIRGYETGGTVHIIANNLLGFTAEAEEGRSTLYASDLAKGFEIPIVHVSADNPEACWDAIHLAFEYRQHFHKDFLIDLVGYRRWGHNEMDDPSVTQPMLYQTIQKHETVRQLFAKKLEKHGVLSAVESQKIEQDVQNGLRDEYAKVSGWHEEVSVGFDSSDAQAKAVPLEKLRQINDALLTRPQGFTVYPKLEKILSRRRDPFEGKGQVDWGQAESLAFGTILSDGVSIRLTGQDSERGTFAHRHLVLHDSKTGEELIPLQSLPQAQASFTVHNSPLTESAVLGFEYGYSVQAPQTLVLWEAQFGDFANVAQVLIDQFIMSGRAKWQQSSGLVMLLPHGYEGQGPEHSSGRLERFLQLASQNNCIVANVSTAAQYYHLLRRQAARLGESSVPLVVMTPKSLLRNPRSASQVEELAQGTFCTVLKDHRELDAHKVRRLVLCSGKVSIDLMGELETGSNASSLDRVAYARLEQLYPLPEGELEQLVQKYENLQEVVWLQEEPQNMGAWTYIQPRLQALLPNQVRLRYAGRPEQASPAEGHASDHNHEQARILADALSEVPELVHSKVHSNRK